LTNAVTMLIGIFQQHNDEIKALNWQTIIAAATPCPLRNLLKHTEDS